MQIDEIIAKWFEETVDKINTEIKTDEPVDNLISGILPLAHNYSGSILLLLDNNKKLPAMALLRVLAELTFRLTWCLFTPNEPKETVSIRIERWLKESYRQRRKLLKKILPAAADEEKKNITKEIDALEKEISNIPHAFAGDLYSSLGALRAAAPGTSDETLSNKDQLYPLFYSPFNQAVNPDLIVLSNLIQQDGNVRVFSSDLNKVDCEVLKIYCMSCVFNVISYIRAHYDWDYTAVKEEYLETKRNFKSE